MSDRSPRSAPASVQYTPLTNFADSAVQPALSPDGRMLTFIRGSEPTLGGPGQIYVKLLPDGEPVQLTKDDCQEVEPEVLAGRNAHCVHHRPRDERGDDGHMGRAGAWRASTAVVDER